MSYASVVGGIELRSVRRRATISAEISRFEESYQLTELRDIMVIDADVSFFNCCGKRSFRRGVR